MSERKATPASLVHDDRLICDSCTKPTKSVPLLWTFTDELTRRCISYTAVESIALVTASPMTQFLVWECQPPKGKSGYWMAVQPIFEEQPDANEVFSMSASSVSNVVDLLCAANQRYVAWRALGNSINAAAVKTVRWIDRSVVY